MEQKISNLLTEIDDGFHFLGRNDVYKSSPRVVLPDRVEELGIFSPPVQVHLGMSPVEETHGDKGKDDAAGGDHDDSDAGDDYSIPYLLIAMFDNWLRDSENDLLYRGAKSLQTNRDLPLGVYFVPQMGNQPSAPRPHQLSPGETLTFWVRPREWRKNQFIYMIREKYANPLLEVFVTPPNQLSAFKLPEEKDPEERSVVMGNGDDEPVSDGGWRDVWDVGSDADFAGLSPFLDEEAGRSLNDIEVKWEQGYSFDSSTGKSLRVDILRDLLGTSEQFRKSRKVLDSLNKSIGTEAPEGFLQKTLSLILILEEPEHEQMIERLDEWKVTEAKDTLQFYEPMIDKLEEKGILRTMEPQDPADKFRNSRIQLVVRPSAIYAALSMGEDIDDLVEIQGQVETESAHEKTSDEGAVRQFNCEYCSFSHRSENEDELIKFAKEHMRSTHNISVSRGEISLDIISA